MWFSNIKDQQYSLQNNNQNLLLTDLLMIALLNSLCLLCTVKQILSSWLQDRCSPIFVQEHKQESYFLVASTYDV